VKLGCVFTQTAVDENGRPVRDEAATTYVGAIEAAAAFGWRLYGEAERRGLRRAAQVVVIGDGAPWVWGIDGEQYGPPGTRFLQFPVTRTCTPRVPSIQTPHKLSMRDTLISVRKRLLYRSCGNYSRTKIISSPESGSPRTISIKAADRAFFPS
jgi:hypothetical protein